MELFLYEVVFLFLILLGVAFVTLLERKVLGYVQIRKGPNKVGYFGLVQPFSDAIKLFSSEFVVMSSSGVSIYFLSPGVTLLIFIFSLVVFPLFMGGVDFMNGVIYFFCLGSLGIYGLFGCGWSSGSLYSLLGCIRGVAQMISYEVSLIFIVLCCVVVVGSYDLWSFSFFQFRVWLLWFLFVVFLIWLVSCLAETNRSPFDFAEGESELVSGFNVEYGGFGFSFIFISEYGLIIFMCMMVVMFFMGGVYMSAGLGVFLVYFWIWVRGSYPRYRYDKLMYLAWLVYLPVSVNYLLLCFGMMGFMICV